jgi:hypothetical protein
MAGKKQNARSEATAVAMHECRSCTTSIPASELRCSFCLTDCPTCGEPMPVKARRCNKCSCYRDIRRLIPMTSSVFSTITAMFAVFALLSTQYLNYLNRESKTSISFTGADTRVIYVHVANSGRKASTLRAYRLRFGGLPIETERLVLLNGDSREVKSVIPAGGEARIGLLVRGLTPGRKNQAGVERYSAEEIHRLTDTAQVTLEIDVEESNGSFVRSVAFEGFQMRSLIQNKLSNYGEG